jgi:hypothetical protein
MRKLKKEEWLRFAKGVVNIKEFRAELMIKPFSTCTSSSPEMFV